MSESGVFRVEIDRDFDTVAPEYLSSRCSECRLILDLLADDRFDDIRIIGHRMKGTGGSYGFDGISEIGERLEAAALAHNADAIRLAVSSLQAYLEGVVVDYV